jgi:orotate phosphoribosyltransferase
LGFSTTLPVSAIANPISLRAELGDPILLADYLSRPGVLRSGHFRLLSGLHSDHFLAFSQIAKDERALDSLAALLVPTIGPWHPDTVLAPSTAGVTLAAALAQRLGIAFQLATLDEHDRPDGIGADARMDGARVLLVNDVVTTGQGLERLASLARGAGATLAGAAWFASRAPIDVAAKIGAPAALVLSLDLPAVDANACQACVERLPIEDAIDLN